MSGFSDYKTDDQLEKDGIWLEYGKGMRILCGRAGGANKHYQRTLESVTGPYRKAIDAKVLPVEDGEDLLMEVFALSIVFKWEGVTVHDVEENNDMSPLECTPENVLRFFKAIPAVFVNVREAVGEDHLYRRMLDEADSGNS